MYTRPIFNPDLEVDQTNYYWFENGFSSKDISKVSIIVQLSDPSEYKGGILEINTGGGIKAIPQVKGSVVIFPSYLQHRVTPVTSGLRKSLVLWAGGEHYK